ncbi:MAG: NnrS family protein [Gammaproteobacteria bacterium]|nr:NnrS family protein [Gammaproteobacteria bacterium]
MSQNNPPVFLSYAFRPFFLLAGLYAVLALALWITGFHGLRWPGAPLVISSLWHAREMALGFGGGVVAGFLLTAVASWTGRTPLRGPWLLVLVAAWLAGRLAATLGGGLPAPWLAVIDLAFPVLLAVFAGREIVGGGSRRNYGIAAITWVLPALVLLYHLGEAGIIPGADRLCATVMVHLLMLLIAVVGGRVIPLFTANWLRMRGDSRPPPTVRPLLDPLAIALVAVAGAADTLAPDTLPAGLACLLAGAVNLWRLNGWQGSKALSNPLLWSLHLAYACAAAGYVLLGATALGLPLPRTAALHLLTIGGISGMILAMMTRVALGHTGRPLVVVRPIAVAYVLLALAAVLRSFGPLLPGPYMAMIDTAALLWVAAFSLFLWVYAPILTGPRADQ